MSIVPTFADVLEAIGDVPPERILMRPPPGTATEADVLKYVDQADKRLCELVDGVLVEKPTGAKESHIALNLALLLKLYLREHKIGHAFGADGTMRLMPGLVRIPDLCFVSKQRMAEGNPKQALAQLVPDLAVEVLSESNTKAEMARKRRDYFLTGVREVWELQPKTQTALVYTSPTDFRRLAKKQSLDGGDILPGFTAPLAEVFEDTDLFQA